MSAMPTEPSDPGAFVDELRARIRRMLLDELPADSSGELIAKRLNELLVIYGNWRARHVRVVPRTPHLSDELAASNRRIKHQAAVDAIIAKIMAGDDLTPHLSRGIKTAYVASAERDADLGRRRDLDLLISDWGLQHLHLTTAVEADGFVTRTEDLLFALFTPTDAYLLEILGHSSWAEMDLLRTLVSNFPGVGLVASMSGLRPVRQPQEGEHLDLRRGGVAQLVDIDGTLYMPRGLTTAGTPMEVTRRADALLWTLDQLLEGLDDTLNAIGLELDHETRLRAGDGPWSPYAEDGRWGVMRGDVFAIVGDLW